MGGQIDQTTLNTVWLPVIQHNLCHVVPIVVKLLIVFDTSFFLLNAFNIIVLQVINLSFYKLILKIMLSCNAKKIRNQVILKETSWVIKKHLCFCKFNFKKYYQATFL